MRWSSIQRVNLLAALRAQGSTQTIRIKNWTLKVGIKTSVFFKPCSAQRHKRFRRELKACFSVVEVDNSVDLL